MEKATAGGDDPRQVRPAHAVAASAGRHGQAGRRRAARLAVTVALLSVGGCRARRLGRSGGIRQTAAHIAGAPERLLGLGLVPLQHPELVVAALEYAVVELELAGVEISSSAGDVELSDSRLEPFWTRAEELDAVVFLHPFGCTLDERLDRYYLSNTVGQPTENAVALSHLIFSGVLDRHPGLRIVAAHGGGYLPGYIGRSDHAWHVRPEAHGCAEPPSSYLRRLWFDSLVHDAAALSPPSSPPPEPTGSCSAATTPSTWVSTTRSTACVRSGLGRGRRAGDPVGERARPPPGAGSGDAVRIARWRTTATDRRGIRDRRERRAVPRRARRSPTCWRWGCASVPDLARANRCRGRRPLADVELLPPVVPGQRAGLRRLRGARRRRRAVGRRRARRRCRMVRVPDVLLHQPALAHRHRRRRCARRAPSGSTSNSRSPR